MKAPVCRSSTFAPTTTLVAVPVGSTDVPFIFNEITSDFQAVTVQGHLTFRVADPRKLAALLDYSLLPNGSHTSDDPDKLPLRITYAAQNAVRAEIQSRVLKAAASAEGEAHRGARANAVDDIADVGGARRSLLWLLDPGDQAGAGDGESA